MPLNVKISFFQSFFMNSTRSRLLLGCVLFILILLCTASCALKKTPKNSIAINKFWTQKIVAEKLGHWAQYEPVYVDSILKERVTIFNRNEFTPPEEFMPELFLPKRDRYSFPFVIPDSLADRVSYIHPKLNIQNDAGRVSYFSPLLPTKIKDVYVVQVYYCYSLSVEDSLPKSSYRFANRRFELYKWENKELKWLQSITGDGDMFTLPLLKRPWE